MLTQREVAERAGLTITTLSRIENEKVMPTFRTIRTLAAVFDISPQEMRDILIGNQLPLWTSPVPEDGSDQVLL